MSAPPVPSVVEEKGRLNALRRYNILDTDPEPAFDRIATLAAHLFEAPIALVNFVDQNRQWFKAAVGMDANETGLDVSICAHTIAAGTQMVVNDLTTDERFRDNPHVTDVGLEFYAGAPLITPDEYPIGTLCVLDYHPRRPSSEVTARLSDLAAMVVDELELRRENAQRKKTEAALRRSQEKYKSVFEGAGDAILVHDLDGRITDANARANSLFDRPQDEWTKTRLSDLFPPDLRDVHRQMMTHLRAGSDYEVIAEFTDAEGERFWGQLSATPLDVEHATIVRCRIRDVTDQRRAERLQKLQTALFRRMAEGEPLRSVLDHVARFAEEELPNTLVSILSLEGTQLRHRVAPSLPDDFVQFLDGIEIGAEVGSCGTAAFNNREVVVEDIRTDERWTDVREPTLRADLRSCWSCPIRGTDGRVLGTFALYAREPRCPTVEDRQLVRRLAFVASVAFEREQAQAELRRNRTLLEQAEQTAEVGGWEYDVTEDTLQWTDETYRIHGLFPDEEIDIETSIHFYSPEDRPVIRSHIERLLDEGGEYDLELKLRTAGGRPRWVRTIGKALPDEGETRRLVGAIQDITARKNKEQALREERDRFATLFQNLPTPVVHGISRGDEFVVETVNDAFESVFGYDRDDVIGEDLHDIIVPDHDIGNAVDLGQRALNQRSIQAEVERCTTDGPRDFEVQVASREQENGPPETYAIYTDITRRKERQRQLRLLEAAIEHSRLPVLITEADPIDEPGPRLVYANPAFAEVTGYDTDEVMGQSPRLLQGPDTSRAVLDRIRKALETDEPIRDVVRNYRKDGEPFWNDIFIAPVRDDTGHVTHYVSIQDDVTDRIRQRDELREAKEAAEEAARIKSALLSNMNHEFRTPLTSIISFSEVIRDKPELADEFADRILGGGRRLLHTLNTVMDYAELEGDHVSSTPTLFNLGDVATSVLETFRDQAHRKGLSLEVRAPDGPVTAELDRHFVERVLTHLVSNAVKFTEAGSVVVTLRAETNRVKLQVNDTGIGMDPDVIPRLFDEFAQASSGYNRTHEGNGLGLTIVRRLVDRMNGALDVDSAPEEGTCVTVRLPTATSSDDVQTP
jgi:PAS domain S-box-containing protein